MGIPHIQTVQALLHMSSLHYASLVIATTPFAPAWPLYPLHLFSRALHHRGYRPLHDCFAEPLGCFTNGAGHRNLHHDSTHTRSPLSHAAL